VFGLVTVLIVLIENQILTSNKEKGGLTLKFNNLLSNKWLVLMAGVKVLIENQIQSNLY